MTDQMTDSERPSTVHGLWLRAPSARAVAARYALTGIWFVYLINPVANLFGHRHSVLWIAGGVALAAAFCGTFFVAVSAWRYRPQMGFSAYGCLFALALIACVVYGQDWIVVWIFVSSATGWVFRFGKPTLRAVAVVTACYGLMCWTTHLSMSTFLSNLLPVAFLGLATSGVRYQIRLVRELSEAKETVAKLAASEERLRLARDMHDLTGQSLSMITLKSDLMRRLLGRLPDSQERDRVLVETDDINRVSRQTLHDIREAVSGYRRPTLAVEIITARSALEAAGIDLDDDPGLTLRSGTFDADAEAALAWCLREAVTNVIRHSGARHCQIRLLQGDDELSVEVSDDGHGLPGDAARCPAALAGAQDRGVHDGGAQNGMPASAGGSGLHGMSERVTALGGRLSFGPATAAGRSGPGQGLGRSGQGSGRPGLRVTATVPARLALAVPPASR
jgi:two-component system, NarL family, sensor histidine kinase DesK